MMSCCRKAAGVFSPRWGLKGGAMSTLRVSFWSAVGLILLTAVAWAFLVIFFQTVSVSIAQMEKQVLAGFNPVHLGPQNDSVSLSRPGIPLQANSTQRIGGKDLAEWLQASSHAKSVASSVNQMVATIGKKTDTDLRVLPLSKASAETILPVEHHGSGTVLVLIAIPPDRSGSLSVQWVTKTDQTTVSRNIKPAAIPASGTSGTMIE